MIIKQILEDMVEIPAGEFMMGSEEGDFDEEPAHLVSLEAFSIGKYQVTQDQYEAVMGTKHSLFKGRRRPVENISWFDAQEFCQRLTELIELAGNTKTKFKLPSEAQWEYACKAGDEGRWCFGDNKAELEDYAWYDENSEGLTHPVGEKKPNAFGLYDIHGNVREWCEDHWHNSYEGAPTDGGPWVDDDDANTDQLRVIRGGSWSHFGDDCRSSCRDFNPPGVRDYAVGFRVVLVERKSDSEFIKTTIERGDRPKVIPKQKSDSELMKGSIEIYSKKKEGED